MSIQNALNTAIYSQLAGTSATALTSLLAGGTGGTSVFFEQAPDNQTTPYIVWLYPSELDTNIIPHRMKDVVLRVYAVVSSDISYASAKAGTIDAAIDTLLHEVTLTMGTGSGYTNIWTRRENGYQLITTSEAGVRYYTSGADYRVNLTKG
jgi:hypothetical protein